jgi:hypothetical protein
MVPRATYFGAHDFDMIMTFDEFITAEVGVGFYF